MVPIERYHANPLITPEDVTPTIPGCKVVGVFNAATAVFEEEIILILRVAESAALPERGEIVAPVYDPAVRNVVFVRLNADDVRYDFSDPRVIRGRDPFTSSFLTSISYLRLARSQDGHHFTIEDRAFLFPHDELDAYGIEDPRCSKIGDQYYIAYTAVSRLGACVGLASTRDFTGAVRHGVIFPPENKDVVLFPEMINGRYYAIHRPVPSGFGAPEMWIAESRDLVHWGNHRFLMGLRQNFWDCRRIGAGAAPIRTPDGWLEIYHAVDGQGRYCLGATLLDLHDPSVVLARTDRPLLIPEEQYEISGFFPNVVFTCGAVVIKDRLRIYYGAADVSMACMELRMQDVLDELRLAVIVNAV